MTGDVGLEPEPQAPGDLDPADAQQDVLAGACGRRATPARAATARRTPLIPAASIDEVDGPHRRAAAAVTIRSRRSDARRRRRTASCARAPCSQMSAAPAAQRVLGGERGGPSPSPTAIWAKARSASTAGVGRSAASIVARLDEAAARAPRAMPTIVAAIAAAELRVHRDARQPDRRPSGAAARASAYVRSVGTTTST